MHRTHYHKGYWGLQRSKSVSKCMWYNYDRATLLPGYWIFYDGCASAVLMPNFEQNYHYHPSPHLNLFHKTGFGGASTISYLEAQTRPCYLSGRYRLRF